MRIITGALSPTPTPWLPVLSHIAPPYLRRVKAAAVEWGKANNTRLPYQMPIKRTLDSAPPERLPSRKRFWSNAEIKQPSDIGSAWRASWQPQECSSTNLVRDPSIQLPGFNSCRQIWTTLNCIRTGVGRCNYNLHKWGLKDSPACDCGAPVQTMAHIVEECPARLFPGGSEELNKLTQLVVDWIQGLDIKL